MEPVNLDPSSGDSEADARLDALLRTPSAALPDDGFSARVLTGLPRRHLAPLAIPSPWSRTAICSLAALFGTLAALAGFALQSDWDASWSSVITAFTPAAQWFSDPLVLTSLVLAVASSLYALRLPGRRMIRWQ